VGMLTVGEVVLESPTATMRLKMPECHVGEVSKDLDVGRRHSQLGDETNSQLVRRVDVHGGFREWRAGLVAADGSSGSLFLYSADEGYGKVSQTVASGIES
jgi:hypothetical protein